MAIQTQHSPHGTPNVPRDRLAIFVIQINGVHQFAIHIKLKMKSGTVADTDRGTATVALEVIQSDFRNVRLAANSEHNGQSTIRTSGLCEALHDKVHICISLGLEAKPKENVYGKTRVPDPRIAIVPVSHTSYIFRQRKGRSSDNGTSRFCYQLVGIIKAFEALYFTICQQLQNHQTP